jgi:demethylmenaquinone methyltransferase/2-methoxy-6-polyprenyl-1,4-benzoquinol methylase
VVALEITQMRAPGFTALFRLYFHRVVPWIGQLVGGDREAYSYLPQSVDRFVTPGELVALMGKVGLRGVTYRRLGLGTVTIHTGIV